MINCNNLTGFFVWKELAATILAAVTAGLVAVTFVYHERLHHHTDSGQRYWLDIEILKC
jgi:hypothetical protein